MTPDRRKRRRAVFFPSAAGLPSPVFSGIRLVEFESGL
jgi:hypothetical protein